MLGFHCVGMPLGIWLLLALAPKVPSTQENHENRELPNPKPQTLSPLKPKPYLQNPKSYFLNLTPQTLNVSSQMLCIGTFGYLDPGRTLENLTK